MKCEQAEMMMAELLAGEIRPADREALERHLLDCATCRADFELARSGFRVDWPEVAVPKELVESTLASFRQPSGLVRFLRAATAAAAALSVALLMAVSGSSPKPASLAVVPVARQPMLAMVQDAVVGAMVCKDEEGRPVGELGLKQHLVSVEILDGVAKTTVEENFENHTARRLEGTFHFPLPPDASISRLALEVNGKIEEGTCLERERAREVFEGIVRKMQDPALLEWMPGGMFKCRVFPIEPRSTKRVIVAYTQALPFFRGKMSYVYPLASEKTKTHPPEEVRIDVQAKFSGRLTKMESTSHRVDVQRRGPGEARMTFRAANYRPSNDFVLALETSDEEVRVVPHKVDGDDGYFACFVTPGGEGERRPGRYTFVVDCSASVSAPELEVEKRLVRGMMENRIAGDRFEVIAHNIDTESSGEVDVRAANTFMDRLQPIGGCDVLKALRAAPEGEVIYIGEGTPTFGETDPAKILEAVKGKRIRTIAVGSDANLTLLEKLGGLMRVSPNDDVPKRVSEIAATLGSPMISSIRLEGDVVYDVVGARDVFRGERLLLTGRYRGQTGRLVVTGEGYRREVDVAFPAKEESNNYVRRLWAQRQVADLMAQPDKKAEITVLGVKHQIMTPFTSFLVLETEQMWKDHQLKREVQKQDEVLGAADKPRRLLEEGCALYKSGKVAEAAARFEEAFQLSPSSDQVYAFIKRAGEDLVGRMMNEPDRKMQDTGRRLMELAKPGEPMLEGKAVVQKYLEELKSEDHAVWRNSFWHMKNLGPHAVKELLPALGEAEDRYRSRVMILLNEIGPAAVPAVTEALQSSNPFVRSNAAIVLGNLKDERALPALRRLSEEAGESANVRKYAAEAVRKISRTDSPNSATPVLPEPAVRRDPFQKPPPIPDLKPPTPAPEQPKPVAPPPPIVKPPPSPVVPEPAPVESRPIVAPPRNIPEDPTARAIREAYEEQLKRDRQETNIARNPTLNELRELNRIQRAQGGELLEKELRMQDFSGVDVELAGKKGPARWMGGGQPSNHGGFLGTPGDPTASFDGTPWIRGWTANFSDLNSGTPLRVHYTLDHDARNYVSDPRSLASITSAEADFRSNDREGNMVNDFWTFNVGGLYGATADSQIHSILTNVTVPGAPITDPLPARLDVLLAGQGITTTSGDFFYRPWKIEQTNLPEVRKELESLKEENVAKAARISDLQREVDFYRTLTPKLEGDQSVLVRQLEVQLGQIQELTSKVEEHRGKLAKSLNEKSFASAELQYARQLAQRLQQDLSQLEEKHVDMARSKKVFEEKINALSQAGVNVTIAPRKPLEAKITAVANEIGLEVLSVGKDDGVLEGDEFTIFRGGEFVAKIVIDRVDRKWSAGKVVLKKRDPQVGDEVSNHAFVSAPASKAGSEVACRLGLMDVAGIAGNRVLLRAGSKHGLAVRTVVALTRDGRFMALAEIDVVDETQAQAVLLDGWSAQRVLPGDRAEVVPDARAFIANLAREVKMELASRASQKMIRAKMELKP